MTTVETSPLRAQAAQTITTALTSGNLCHPNRPNIPLIFPGFNTTAHPDPNVVDAISQTAHMLGEALIDTVLAGLNAKLITKPDLEKLRATANNAPAQLVTVTCKHRKLVRLVIKPGSNKAEIDCRRLRQHLADCQQ